MKTRCFWNIMIMAVLFAGVGNAWAQESDASGSPCPEGQALRELEPELMAPEDWEFLLAYDCPLLERLAIGDWPDMGPQSDDYDDQQTSWEEALVTGLWSGSNESEPSPTGEDTSMNKTEAAEPPKVDGASWVEWRSEPEPSATGFFPRESTPQDDSLAELQASFLASGCAATPMPGGCTEHPYFVYSQQDEGGVAWDTLN